MAVVGVVIGVVASLGSRGRSISAWMAMVLAVVEGAMVLRFWFMFRNFFPINGMHRGDVSNRNGYPLGDETWKGQLLEASR